jgi:hypothetical protein
LTKKKRVSQETLIKTFLQPKQPSIKQGMPVEKKSLLMGALMSILILLAVAGERFVGLGRANAYSNLDVVYGGQTAAPPNTEPPKIAIDSIIWNSGNNVSISFDVCIGESESIDNVSSMIIASVYYKADWQENNTYVYEYVSNPSNPSNTRTEFSASLHFVEIPEGKRTLTVYATERGSYYNLDPSIWPMFGTVYYYGFNETGSSSISFTIDTTPPSVIISSMKDETYSQSEIQLSFTTSEPVSQTSYVLDGQENVTVAGNTTLAGLSCGVHNVTVYAWDEAGNAAASETVYFTIMEPEPEPFPTLFVGTVSVGAIALVGASLIIYFKKRKR